MAYVFDGHSDILCHVAKHRAAGETRVFQNYHAQRLAEGNIGAMIAAVWIERDYVQEPTERMLEILGYASQEFRENQDVLGIIKKADDLKALRDAGKTAILWGMEGLSGLKGRTVFLEALYDLGVRHAMLTWNEENEFAVGAGDTQGIYGLKPAGIAAVHLMEKLGMIVDVSHASEKTFYGIAETATKPLLASHSNAYALCPAKRNLKDEQIRIIASTGGVIGMNAWPAFIDEKAPSAEKLANHVDYIVNLVGIDHVGCGFDFCDFLDDNALSFAEPGQVSTKDLEDATKVRNFTDILKRRGYDEEALEKIMYKNMERLLYQTL